MSRVMDRLDGRGKGHYMKHQSSWGIAVGSLVILGALVASTSSCSELLLGEPMSYEGIPGASSIPTGQGVGETCSDGEPCRSGLDCVESVCAPGMSKGEGELCVIGPECAEDLQCLPAGLCPDGSQGCPACLPAGDGQLGGACQSDADCSSGLRCGLNGFSAECVQAGTGDVGAACQRQEDCFQGLYCSEGECGVTDPSWKGVSCTEPDDDAVAALFHIPGAPGTPAETDFFSLPFPNDVRTDGDGRPDLDGFPTPGSALLGKDVVAQYVEAVERNTRGFSTNPSIVFRFSGAIDSTSLEFTEGKRPVVLVDADDPGGAVNRLGIEWSSGSAQTNYVCDDWLAASPRLGAPLLPGHTYIAWITTDARAKNGSPVARSPQFETMLANEVPSDPTLAVAYARYTPLRTYLSEHGIDPDTILTAAVFTTDDPLLPMRELAEAVASEPVPSASDWVLCGDGVASPCPQSDGARGCVAGTAAYEEYQALVELPIFQSGDAPYLEQGGDVQATVVRTEEVCMSLTVPTGTAPDAGWPLLIFGHGTGGSFRSHVREEVAGALAQGAPAIAVLGIDQVQHGPRRGQSDEDPETLFFNFGNPDAARGNPLQGAVDQLSLTRFARSLSVSAEDTGGRAISIDPARVSLFGHSQGATHHSLALPMSDLTGAVLSGNGGSLKHALLYKKNPVNIAGAIPLILQDVAPDGSLRMGDKNPVLGLLQHYIDAADPLNFAPLLLQRPEMGRSVKHVFETFGLDDSYSPPQTMAAFIYATQNMDLAPHPPGVAPRGANLLTLSPSAGAVSLNVEGTSATVTGVTRQYDIEGDGHFVVFEDSSANEDALGFSRALLSEGAPTVPAP